VKKLLTLVLALVTVAVLTGAVLAGATPWPNRDHAAQQESQKTKNKLGGSTVWLNRDQPSGVGDYETTRDHLQIACRFKKKSGGAITEGSPVGYHCNIKEGGWCKNNKAAGLKCDDMEVMFSWAGGSTPWLNRDHPSGVGDYETIKDLLTISCQFTAGGAITEGVPIGYHCSMPDGGWCKNNDPANLSCKDMQVMYSW
jgi:predicted small lipoprotein YifL